MSRYDAVLLDAFGTLFELDDPFGRFRRALSDRLDVEVSAPEAERALRAEMAHYKDHCHDAHDAASLMALRHRCAEIVVERLNLDLDTASMLPVLGDALSYRAFPDVEPALTGIRAGEISLAVVSNWDHALPVVLKRLGLEVDLIVTSASARSAKPDPGIFRLALARLGVAPERALHIGDTPWTDGDGARAAGVDVRIIDRGARPAAGTIAALTEIVPLLSP